MCATKLATYADLGNRAAARKTTNAADKRRPSGSPATPESRTPAEIVPKWQGGPLERSPLKTPIRPMEKLVTVQPPTGHLAADPERPEPSEHRGDQQPPACSSQAASPSSPRPGASSESPFSLRERSATVRPPRNVDPAPVDLESLADNDSVSSDVRSVTVDPNPTEPFLSLGRVEEKITKQRSRVRWDRRTQRIAPLFRTFASKALISAAAAAAVQWFEFGMRDADHDRTMPMNLGGDRRDHSRRSESCWCVEGRRLGSLLPESDRMLRSPSSRSTGTRSGSALMALATWLDRSARRSRFEDVEPRVEPPRRRGPTRPRVRPLDSRPCRRWESNPHGGDPPEDFKSSASAFSPRLRIAPRDRPGGEELPRWAPITMDIVPDV